ncbi:MAG: S41 family peptidase [Bacteroidota bacterium]
MKIRFKKHFLVPLVAAFILVTASSFKSDFFEIAKQIEIFTTLFKELNMNYVDETNPAELMDSAIKNMLDELDPYTRFLNEQDVEEYKINNAGEYSGIGALVRSYDDRLLIIEPYEGYPADKAGLKAGDEIIEIGGILVTDFDDNASELLKGANNTTVEVAYRRKGQMYKATIVREGVEVDAVPYYDMVDEKTGYIVLSKFNRKASSQTKAAIIDLKGKGAKQLILDLRGNPGGLLSEAINVTNLFVPKGELIVTTKSKVKKFNQSYKTKSQAVDLDIPLVVLINGSSASASEIVSGGLQDLDRAVVVGAQSFGKGLVQRPLKLTYGTQLKVTISRYYTPSGRCIQSLDYWNRDEQGKAVRNTRFNTFKTRNGRVVKDGGGVSPDIEIASLKTNTLIQALDKNNILFDFATDFYYQNTFDAVSSFTFSDDDYNSFVKYAKKSDFNFQTKTEKMLEEQLNSDESLLGQDVQNKYRELLLVVNQGKIDALNTYKTIIRKKITDELIKRYFYRKGLYDYSLTHDDAISSAVALLNDKDQYNAILN